MNGNVIEKCKSELLCVENAWQFFAYRAYFMEMLYI